MQEPLFIELALSGQVLKNPQRHNKERCFLFDSSSYLLTELEEPLKNTISQKSLEYDKMMHLKKVIDDSAYLFIDCENTSTKIELSVSFPTSGLAFELKDTKQKLSHYLIENYLGKEVSMKYFHCSSAEYLEKYFIEKNLNNMNLNKKTLKL